MLLTLALSGMDSATETALRAAFAGANARLGDCCALVAETESQHVIVDMDSMYGPMSWLRLHAAGKQVIGLTSAPRVQTHFRLARPFDEQAMAALLREVAGSEGIVLSDAPAPDRTHAGNPSHPTAADAPRDVSPAPAEAPSHTTTDADRAADAATPRADDTVTAPPPVAGSPDAHTDTAAASVAAPDAGPSIDAASVPPAAPAAPALDPVPSALDGDATAERPLLAWLAGTALPGRHRLRGQPALLVDFDARLYHGPALLKPLAPLFSQPVARDAFEPLDADTWAREAAALGAPQPLTRLVWFGALLAGDGGLAPGHDPDARYVLHKWPQTEREYPRHFRIATAMMKGPATLPEVVAASGLPTEDIHRFVNASLATGYAGVVADTPVESPEPARASGFLARLRLR